ncbi:hypothetical protein [Aquibacillus albus]|uniref:Uncharacterized protein n=1 Tax=Aquibacillus albus TaxID=1168171 RepID=A0ABS2N3L2_9BACI|nr:hypothetical protein [Aquibacillus albus]MBM7572706.1 hypothetical protein [Aquibacillus albus]
MSKKSNESKIQQTQGQEGCCQGDELLCVSIPSPITIVFLGLEIQIELPCIRINSEENLTSEETQQILGLLTNLLGNIGENINPQ